LKFLNFSQAPAARRRATIASLFLICFASPALRGQASKPEPDTVVFPNGEKLIGHFEGFTGGAAKFKSDTMGEITIDLSKVQELHTSQRYAVIKKGVQLTRGESAGAIPVGILTVNNKNIQVDPGSGKPAQTIAVGDVDNVVDEDSFNKALGHPNILQGWGGEASLGVSLVEATQNSTSFNTSISLLRAMPTEAWLAPRNRTALDFSDSYGKVTQPGTPEVRTSIFHAGAERDEYFTSRVYALGAVAFDHNFSQGLDLQQQYGGGFGWSVIRGAKETLDLKGSVDYERQEFQVATQNQNLINSVFSELYGLKFSKGIVLSQLLSVSPAWNNTNAYSANASVGLTFPVYKGFGFTANVIDSYLNDPPTGFKKNSVQFSTGLSYSIP
jgi:putative salt-induced outer membrane protein YdiY